MSNYVGVGIGNAEEVYFPLDRRHVLAMALPDPRLDGMVMELMEDNVLFVNSLEAAYSHKWVYQHPDDDEIDNLITGNLFSRTDAFRGPGRRARRGTPAAARFAS
jgi:hypothetical protein